MKTTLLEQVHTIEKEAEQIVSEARHSGEAEVANIRTREQQALEEIETAARARGKKIVKERVSGMNDEVGKVTEESKHAAQMAAEAAEKNRAHVIERAHQLFEQEYLNEKT